MKTKLFNEIRTHIFKFTFKFDYAELEKAYQLYKQYRKFGGRKKNKLLDSLKPVLEDDKILIIKVRKGNL